MFGQEISNAKNEQRAAWLFSTLFRQPTVRSGDAFQDRKSTRLNSSHGYISYAVFCLKKKTKTISLNVFTEIVPRIGNSFINTMKNISHTRTSISYDIRNILVSSANMRRAIPLILRLLMN